MPGPKSAKKTRKNAIPADNSPAGAAITPVELPVAVKSPTGRLAPKTQPNVQNIKPPISPENAAIVEAVKEAILWGPIVEVVRVNVTTAKYHILQTQMAGSEMRIRYSNEEFPRRYDAELAQAGEKLTFGVWYRL
jgi:hypothetical protein